MMSDHDGCEPDARRVTQVHSRYHVGNPVIGLAEVFRKRAAAFEAACRLANKDNVTMTVFDSMARRGAGEVWEFFPSPDGGMVTWKQPSRRKS